MSKVKPPKAKGVPNKHLHARTTFLYQAATHLSLRSSYSEDIPSGAMPVSNASNEAHSTLALQLGSDLQQVSRKGQLRLAMDLKRSMCKACNAVLIPGRTATQTMENMSKGGKKSWADVLVIECLLCGGKKRFPVGAQKQASKGKRAGKILDPATVKDTRPPRQSARLHTSGTGRNND